MICLTKDEWSLSSQRYGEDDHFPIARAAVDAIRQLDFHSKEILEQLQNIAIETSDWVVRANLFKVIVEKGGDTFHQRIFEVAVTPGRVDVKRAAAYAMLTEFEILDLKVVHRITVDLLAIQAPSVAVILTIIYACRAQLSERLKIAQELSANHYRRVLILLMLWPKVSPCEPTKLSLKALLPDGHPSIEWINAGPVEYVDDSFIADLGAPDICQEVLHWLNPKRA